jgi:hypothetical protein
MSNRNFSLPFLIVATILGITIYKHFDFNTFTFKESWLDYIYIITFLYVVFILLKKKSK